MQQVMDLETERGTIRADITSAIEGTVLTLAFLHKRDYGMDGPVSFGLGKHQSLLELVTLLSAMGFSTIVVHEEAHA